MGGREGREDEVYKEMPQLDIVTFVTQVFWLVVGISLLYTVVINREGVIVGISRILKVRNKSVNN